MEVGRFSAKEVTGNLREGGHVGALQWQQGAGSPAGPLGMALDAKNLDIRWLVSALGQGRLQVDRLTVQTLTMTVPAAKEATPPPTAVTLPLPLRVAFAVQQLNLQGAMEVQATGLHGSYAYANPDADRQAPSQSTPTDLSLAGPQHDLTLDAVTLAQGQYRFKAQLQANAPMALQAALTGRLSSAVPGGTTVTVEANAQVSGTLADLNGVPAALTVQAHVQPQVQLLAPNNAKGAKGLQTAASGPTLDATARVQPWADQPLHSALLTLTRLSLADFWPQAPVTSLTGSVEAQPQGDGWSAQVALNNTAPGPVDRQRLPVQSLQARVLQQGREWLVSDLKARVGNGSVQGHGRWQGDTSPWQGELKFSGVDPAALYTTLAPTRMDGQLIAKAQSAALGGGTSFDARLQSSKESKSTLHGLTLSDAHAVGLWQGDRLQLKALTVQAAQVNLTAQGEGRIARRSFTGNVKASFPGGTTEFSGQLQMPPGTALPEGDGEWRASLSQAEVAWAWLKQLPVLPALAGLGMEAGAAWRGWAVTGQADLAAQWHPQTRVKGAATSAETAPPQLLQAQLNIPSLLLQAPADANGVKPTPLQISQLRGKAAGPLSALAVQLDGVVAQNPYRAVLNSRATVNLPNPSPTAAQPGQGQPSTARFDTLSVTLQDNDRKLALTLQTLPTAPLQWRWGGGEFEALPGQLRISPQDLAGYKAPRDEAVTLQWQQLLWGAQGLRTQGRLSQFSLAWVDWLAGPQAQPLADLGLSGQLLFDGDWDLHWPRDARTPVQLNAGLQRKSGDLRLAVDEGKGNQQVAAGLRDASLRITAESVAALASTQNATPRAALRAQVRWQSERAGQVDAELSTALQGGNTGWTWPTAAPVQGKLSAQLPQIGVWSLLAPPGWRLRGTLAAQATLSGTRSTPQWQGQVQADQLSLRSLVDGVDFVNGQLRATLSGDRVVIDRFTLEGAGGVKTGGQLNATGSALWAAEAATPSPRQAPRVDLQVTLDKLRLSSRVDRRLVASGQLQAQLVGMRLQLRGKLRADQATITLPDELTPSLGDDVVIRGRQPATSPSGAPAATQVVPDVLVDLDLGSNFSVQGHGLKARLEGSLQARSTREQPRLQVHGEVRSTSGTYRAYGVNLTVETGVLRFAGPPDNPSLNILAIRPNISQRAGVQVTGTAQSPVVRLYAEPDLPDSEKLSWVVLGRSAAGPGGEAAILQQAALSLLGRPGNSLEGGIAGRLGLDDLSYRSGGVNADGSVSSAAVSLGKRLSSKLYVVYGQSLTSSIGTISVLYDLSRRLTLRAKAGEENVLELIFTQRYD